MPATFFSRNSSSIPLLSFHNVYSSHSHTTNPLSPIYTNAPISDLCPLFSILFF